MYLISFYVPETHLESVKTALFTKGAGRIGNYDCCAWQTNGQGQFRPLKGSHPFSGEQDKIERTGEYKVEMVCRNGLVKDVLETLVSIHPYEEPAYHVVEVKTINNL